ncbi:SETMR methyltransferase, partial [Acromyrmex heyeri]
MKSEIKCAYRVNFTKPHNIGSLLGFLSNRVLKPRQWHESDKRYNNDNYEIFAMADILNIGGEPIFDDRIVKFEIHTYNPYINTFGHSDEIRIPIQQQDLYTLPCESILYLFCMYLHFRTSYYQIPRERNELSFALVYVKGREKRKWLAGILDSGNLIKITEIRNLLTKWENKNYIVQYTYKKLYVSDGEFSRSYGLPKIHKEDHPVRMIVSCINNAFYQLMIFLKNIIKKLNGIPINNNFSTISFDVVLMYTNILTDIVIKSIEDIYLNCNSSVVQKRGVIGQFDKILFLSYPKFQEKNISNLIHILLINMFQRNPDEFLRRFKKKRPRLTKKKVLFHQDNARVHTYSTPIAKFNEFRYELLPHPAYSPDLVSCDYFLFPNLKKWFEGKRFSIRELIAETEAYFEGLDKSYYSDCLKKLENRWIKCIELKGNYIEK